MPNAYKSDTTCIATLPISGGDRERSVPLTDAADPEAVRAVLILCIAVLVVIGLGVYAWPEQ